MEAVLTILAVFDVIRPNAAVVHDVFNVAPIYTWDFTPDIAHSSVFYAASCVVQSLYDIALPSYDGNPSREVLIHKGRALTSLREELLACGNLISDHLLMAVLYLCMFELQYGTAKDRKIHQNTLLQLIKLRGGLHRVGEHARAIISNYYFFSSVATGSNLIGTVSGVRFPSSADRRMMHGYKPLFQNLPGGFRVFVRAGNLSSSTLEALLRINREHCRRHSASCYEDRTILDFRNNRLEYSDWWEALPSTLLPDVDGEVAFEKLLCMGLILFVCYFFSPDRTSSSTLKLLRGSLTKLLTENVSFQDADQDNCAAWVWAVTIVTHIGKKGLNADAAALRTLMLKRYPELRAPKQAREALERFFYEEELVAAMQIRAKGVDKLEQ